ncbi:MAG: hypothetical protein AABY09_01510 [Nanoarchaeota archaeon]
MSVARLVHKGPKGPKAKWVHRACRESPESVARSVQSDNTAWDAGFADENSTGLPPVSQ